VPVFPSGLDRILLVDDDLALRMAISQSLLQAGLQVWQTGNAAVALQSITSCAPDVLLLDVELPQMNGFELYDKLRATEEGRDVPVIFMSGSRLDESSVVRGLSLGASDYLRKPFGNNELVARVAGALRSRRTQLELLRLGTTDGLTQLLNRRAFFEALERERRRAERTSTPMSVLLFDIDHFKQVNDTYGHPAGDRVLLSMSRLVQSQCRVTDVIGRIGGEEFALVLPATDLEGARGMAEKLREAIASLETDIGFHTVLKVTASFGVASAPGPTFLTPDTAVALLADADAALYLAKRGGRDRVEVASRTSPVAPATGVV
jgi:diguanylate cyclase (GGDEF)-like protein